MNALDRIVSWVSPYAGLQRRHARELLASYEGAKPSRLRKHRQDTQSPNQLVEVSATALRAQARYLERNHDLARGILRTLVNNIVGPNGIGIEPQPRNRNGEIHEAYAKALREAFVDWCLAPEVTRRHHWARTQRLTARTWLRDGEAFAQMLQGNVAFLDHGTRVPFSLELLEPDLVPLDYDDGDRIRQGIERNAWGRTVAVHLYRSHPLDTRVLQRTKDLKRVPAEQMLHLAAVDRIGQLRGVSEFASILTRLEDIKDYEESERVAAKIAARLTAYVKKGDPTLFDSTQIQRDEQGNVIPREIAMSPGMIIDGLGVGEEIGMVDSKRPNPNLITFRQGQLRATAGGVGASYSSISRDYNGTFSAQRQELVEQWVHYAVLTDDFVGQWIQPVWTRFVLVADLSGVVPRPRDVDPLLADDALFVAQAMPWIDPYKEAQAWELLVRAGFASEVEAIRRRGGNPRDLLEQVAAFRKQAKEKELIFSADAANDKKTAAATEPAPEDNAADGRRSAVDVETEARAIAAALARTPQAADPQHLTVNVHQAPVTVNQAPVNVATHLPEQPAPKVDVHVEANMPEQAPPNVDVRVEAVMPAQAAPKVDVNVHNNVPPAEVTVKLPARKTDTTVERDRDGNLTRATQVETDL